MIKRNAYLLQGPVENQPLRAQFSRDLLIDIGFNVNVIEHIPNESAYLSNKLSVMHIFDLIQKSNEEWSYMFEDDVDTLEEITLEDIVEYENISEMFFYLGVCMASARRLRASAHKIKDDNVKITHNGRCLHAIAISKKGINEIIPFYKTHDLKSPSPIADAILESFSKKYPANVVRSHLASPQNRGHRGVFFQDRRRFSTQIWS
jgi:hypothetical protein